MSQWPAIVTLPRRVGICIPARNCAATIGVAIHCAQIQTHKPARILVVNDGSKDGTREIVQATAGVEYKRINHGRRMQACFAKRAGFAELSKDCDYVLAIDADGDLVPPDYVAKLLAAIESDCRAAVAYPRVQQFGIRSDVIHREWDREWLSRENYIPSTSLFRVDALQQIGGWPETRELSHDDWACVRLLAAHGWRGVRADVTYYWRRHEASCSFRPKKWCQSVDLRNLVTIACPFSGRTDTLKAWQEAIVSQTFPHEHLSLLLYDNSGDPHFGRLLRCFAAQLDNFADVRIVTDRTPCVSGKSNRDVADEPKDASGKRPHAEEIMHRVAGCWNRIGQLASTDLVFAIEDDIIVPPDALGRLLASMAPDVAAVTGAYRSRFTEQYVAWDWQSLRPLRQTHIPRLKGVVQQIGGCGMGCVLIRRQELTAAPARSAGDGNLASPWYDPNLFAGIAHRHEIDRVSRVLIDWDVVPEHRDG